MRQGTALLEVLAVRFLSNREALADAMVDRIREDVVGVSGFDGPELGESMRASCRANIEEGLGSLARDRSLPGAIPADARDLALITARLDLPLGALLRAYRVAHALMWQAWFEAVEREPADPGTRRVALEAG